MDFQMALKRVVREQSMRNLARTPQRNTYTKDSNIISWSQVTDLPAVVPKSVLQRPDGTFPPLLGYDPL